MLALRVFRERGPVMARGKRLKLKSRLRGRESCRGRREWVFLLPSRPTWQILNSRAREGGIYI